MSFTATKAIRQMNDDDHQTHVALHQHILEKELEHKKKLALAKAEELLVTAVTFTEIAEILSPYVKINTLIEFWDIYQEVNVIYNSPLTKALNEEE